MARLAGAEASQLRAAALPLQAFPSLIRGCLYLIVCLQVDGNAADSLLAPFGPFSFIH